MEETAQAVPSAARRTLLPARVGPMAINKLSPCSLQSPKFPQPDASPPEQLPWLQKAPITHPEGCTQSLPSRGSGLWAQPLAGSQKSTVHGLPSPQPTLAPLQAPLLQVSEFVHLSLSSQGWLLADC